MGDLTTIVGFMAGFVTTAANLPQVWKTYRSKSAEGLSFRMLLALAFGLGMWIVYGIMSKLPPLIVTNAVALLRHGRPHHDCRIYGGIRDHRGQPAAGVENLP
jgi:MtN3 and saliva related transmembrane protein